MMWFVALNVAWLIWLTAGLVLHYSAYRHACAFTRRCPCWMMSVRLFALPDCVHLAVSLAMHMVDGEHCALCAMNFRDLPTRAPRARKIQEPDPHRHPPAQRQRRVCFSAHLGHNLVDLHRRARFARPHKPVELPPAEHGDFAFVDAATKGELRRLDSPGAYVCYDVRGPTAQDDALGGARPSHLTSFEASGIVIASSPPRPPMAQSVKRA